MKAAPETKGSHSYVMELLFIAPVTIWISLAISSSHVHVVTKHTRTHVNKFVHSNKLVISYGVPFVSKLVRMSRFIFLYSIYKSQLVFINTVDRVKPRIYKYRWIFINTDGDL